MQQDPHIFISYSRQDTFFARYLKDYLEESSYTVWMDVHGIKAGEEWGESIDYAIKNCFVTIVIISPSSMESPYVHYEWSYALGSQVAVIPVYYRLLDNYQDKVRSPLNKLEYADFTNRDTFQWGKLMNAVGDVFREYNERRQQVRTYLSVDRLRAQIASGSDIGIITAMNDVLSLGITELTDSIHEKSASDNPDIRANALTILWSMDRENSIDKLINALSDSDLKVRQQAYTLLGQTQHPDLIHKLLRLAEATEVYTFEGRPVGRINAIKLLAVKLLEVSEEDSDLVDYAMNKLVRLTSHENPHVAGNAIRQFEILHMGGMDMIEYVELLEEFSADDRRCWLGRNQGADIFYEIRRIAGSAIYAATDIIPPSMPLAD